jgi:hypothetical protein
MEGLFLIIERSSEKGLRHWGEELERRSIPAVIQIDGHVIEKEFEIIKSLSNKGFEIGGGYNEKPLWGEPYKFQFDEMKHIKEKVESCTRRPMRVFHSKYFAYDENTLASAESLGIQYILARGTAGAKAVIYKPKEFNVKILSVSNVPSNDLGTGSLCDESLWCRGVTPEGFKDILFNLKEDKIILVAQTHLSGVKLHWWNVYQEFLNANRVVWKSINEFTSNPIVIPNPEIPINREVKYMTPQPKIPLDEEPDYPFKVG